MKPHVVFVMFLAVISGCASIGTPITQSNKEVQMPHYSVVVPPDTGWHLSKPDNNKFEVTVLTKDIGPLRFQIRIMWVPILDERMRTVTARTVADDYRNLEHQIMLKEGVAKGHYQLHNLVMEEENVGDKNFYTMKYAITGAPHTQRAKLLLYFPKEEKNEYFILAHYSESGPENASSDEKPIRNELLETLRSLRTGR